MILVLILPIIIENIFQVSANVVSAAMVGRLTSQAISAQGISFNISALILIFIKGIGIGASVLIAKAYGAKEYDTCKNIFENGLIFTIIIVFGLQCILFFGAGACFELLTKDTEVISQAIIYIRILIFGFPFLVIMSFVTAIFQGHGDTKTPMYIAVVMNIVNLVLGYILIFGAIGMPAMGVYGAAIALVIAQGVGALIGLVKVYGHKGLLNKYSSKKQSFIWSKSQIREIYMMGIPVSFESMFWQLSAIVMSKIILSYGDASFAAYQLGIQAETLTEMPAIGFGVAAVTLSARAIGERNKEQFKSYFENLVFMSFSISVVTSLLLVLCPKLFMKILTDNSELQSIGVVYIMVMGFIQIPQNLSRIYNGTIRASGYKNIPMIIAGTGIWLFRIPLALLIAYRLKWSITFIWVCIAVDQLVRFILSVSYFKYKKILETTISDEEVIVQKGDFDGKELW